jgi:hypothetical protein
MPAGKYIRTPEIIEKARITALTRKERGTQGRGWKQTDEQRCRLAKIGRQRTGEKNPFFGKSHSEETRAKISKSRTGEDRTPEERKQQKQQHTKNWLVSHPEQVKEYDKKYLSNRALNNQRRRQKLRHEVIQKMGGKCSSPNCRWVNDDGSTGCTDERLLQIDHVNGGGYRERKELHVEAYLKKVLNNSFGYQLLCSNCNWLKRCINNETTLKYGG